MPDWTPAAKNWWAERFYLIQARRSADSNLLRHMVQVRDRYNAPMVFPLTDVAGEPDIAAPVPMILADAIDSGAMRASSQEAGIICPAIERQKPKGVRSLEYADIRRSALQADWYQCAMNDLILPRAYRHLIGYGTWNIIVVPDFETQDVRVELRDPLTAYPELRAPEDTRAPLDCVYVYGKSTAWLRAKYPEAKPWIAAVNSHDDDLWDLCEWVDADYVAIGVLGPRKVSSSGYVSYGGLQNVNASEFQNGMMLRRWDNRAGVVPIGTPRRATLDQIFGQVAQMVPLADMYGRLAALNYIAAEREVFPDLALVGNQIGRVPTLEGGRWADGRSGEINTVLDGDVKVLQAAPGPMTRAALSDLERTIRMGTGQTGLASGDPSGGAIRSGNQIDAFAAIAMDPRTLELHRQTQRALVPVNEAIMATKKGYWPDKKYVVFAGGTSDGLVEYTPREHFETTANAVKYPLAGYDASQARIAMLQMVTTGLMPKDEAMQKDPLIDDWQRARRQIQYEQALEAIVAANNQHILEGTTLIKDAVTYARALRDGDDVLDAIEAADDAASKRNAELANSTATPGAVTPEQAPGLQPAAEQQLPAAVPGPTQGQANLEDVLLTLGKARRAG